MSRIYEALRRAEEERLAGIEPDEAEESELSALEPGPGRAWHAAENSAFRGELETYTAVLPNGAPPLDPLTAPVQATSREATHQALHPGTLQALHPGTLQALDLTRASQSPVDLDSIASAPWVPVLEHLPAVRERGRTVEQFRSLRSRLQEFRGANRTKSILVTSGLPQEGKSFVAVNLAISLARHKINRVLLIDGDMRRSSLHKVLGCPNDGLGLTEYLAGDATLQEIMKRPEPNTDGAPLPHGFASLVFIGAGKEADKAADLSGNHRFDELIATVAPLFDWVIVDSSPVNLVSDGVNLARACDGVLLIARGEVTKFETAQQAVAALEAAKILGVVLNAVNDSFASGGYYDYDSAADKSDQAAARDRPS